MFDWFLYNEDLRHERVKIKLLINEPVKTCTKYANVWSRSKKRLWSNIQLVWNFAVNFATIS